MKICSKCKAENRPAAAFCARCGAILLAQAVPTPPTTDVAVSPEPQVVEIVPKKPALPPVSMQGSPSQPDLVIFGERFRSISQIYKDDRETQYLVIEMNQPPAPCIRICSNPDCLTIHSPNGTVPENYCTYCGKPLDRNSPLLLLREAESDLFGNLQPVLDLHLAFPHVQPPLAVFTENGPTGDRYYLVSPYAEDLPSFPDSTLVLQWGKQLAESLDYLHSQGVAFGGELEPSIFGLAKNNIVWRNFSSARVLPMLADREKINNIRLLALSLYSLITGKATYSEDPSLSPGLRELFQQALVGEGFTSGIKLAEMIDQTIKAGLSPLNLDYQTGHRTHTGMIRSSNEDSLMCLTLSRIQQGVSQPVGLFAIADGMGGHDTGELASSLSIDAITKKAFTELAALQNLTREEYTSWLMQLVQAANLEVYDSRQDSGSDMGSTLVCALLLGHQAYLAHIGDSRAYLLRDESIKQLTVDHSLVQHMVNIGQISADEARNHPQRNVIYRSLGDKSQAEVDIFTQNLLPGDRLLLCSDGLSGTLDDQVMLKIILQAGSPQVACDRLVEAANLAGGADNITAIVVEISSA